MITLENDRLVFRFSEVHEHAHLGIDFQRTLRIPDDGTDYPLPPGLGAFPLRHLDDHATRLPQDWSERGGVIMPMHQAEAMWVNFSGSYPMAIKVATGKICAVSGEPWVNHLNQQPQDYVVVPTQPWLDGYAVEEGVIRQFVAMPLGDGYSVEEQITGDAEHGGVQIIAYPMKAARYEEIMQMKRDRLASSHIKATPAKAGMGLAPGGRMRQKIYEDRYGLDAWDQRHFSRCFVTIANTAHWLQVTGETPPQEPPTAADYARAGLPWFDYYDENSKVLAGSDKLAGMKSVVEMGKEKGEAAVSENESVWPTPVVHLGRQMGRPVREMAG